MHTFESTYHDIVDAERVVALDWLPVGPVRHFLRARYRSVPACPTLETSHSGSRNGVPKFGICTTMTPASRNLAMPDG